MEIWTRESMAEELGISPETVKKRLQRKKRTPVMRVGSGGIYTKADLEAIRGGGTIGRPRKDSTASKGKTKPKSKPKKTTKKT